MKNKIKDLAVLLLIIFCLAPEAFAADKKLTVSCIIPAIPGETAPIVDDGTSVGKKEEQEADKKSNTTDKIIPTLSADKKDSIKNIFFLSEKKTDAGLIQTVYSR